MTAERARTFLLSLPHTVETAQFGGIVFWVGDKAIGGKMMAMINDAAAHPPHRGLCISYPVDRERFHEVLERDGLRPAPYLARAGWVSAEQWDAFSTREWEAELSAAHALVAAKLAAGTRRLLEGPKAELRRAVLERRRIRSERAEAR